MKKYIAIATLLAAGSAFANAEAQTIALKADKDLKVNESGVGSLISTNGALTWDSASYGSLTSWRIDFTLSTVRNGLDNVDLLDLTNGGGPRFALNSDGSFEWYNGTLGSINSEWKWNWTGTDDSINLSISYVADYKITGESIGTGILLVQTGETTILSVKNLAAGEMSTLDSGDVRIWSNGGKEHYSDITLTKLNNNVIPEPSTFGLLAGLGALALVGTRRRRK